jgi:hypothetical protein
MPDEGKGLKNQHHDFPGEIDRFRFKSGPRHVWLHHKRTPVAEKSGQGSERELRRIFSVYSWRPIQSGSVQPASKTGCFKRVFQKLSRVRSTEPSGFMERAMGIEPTSEAWEASILPLYDARSTVTLSNRLDSCKECTAV